MGVYIPREASRKPKNISRNGRERMAEVREMPRSPALPAVGWLASSAGLDTSRPAAPPRMATAAPITRKAERHSSSAINAAPTGGTIRVPTPIPDMATPDASPRRRSNHFWTAPAAGNVGHPHATADAQGKGGLDLPQGLGEAGDHQATADQGSAACHQRPRAQPVGESAR